MNAETNMIDLNKPINNAELKQVLTEYFLSDKPEKPLVILSKPFSGRTETIKAVAKDLGICDTNILNCSTRHCPPLHSEYMQEKWGKDSTFDNWLESYIQMNYKDDYKKFKYCIIEIEPNEFLECTYVALWESYVFGGYFGMGYGYLNSLQSDKFQLIAYYPTVDEWIKWAKDNSLHQETIDFAEAYPEFYGLISYRAYMGIESEFERLELEHFKSDVFCIKFAIGQIDGVRLGDKDSLFEKALVRFLSEKGIPYKE